MSTAPPSDRNVRHLFVYGTLLPDQAPSELMPIVQELRSLGNATLHGARLYDLGEFPAALPVRRASVVHGKLFELPARAGALLNSLDVYEEAKPPNGLFRREVSLVRLPGGRRTRAWVYYYNRTVGDARPIPSGRFARPSRTATA